MQSKTVMAEQNRRRRRHRISAEVKAVEDEKKIVTGTCRDRRRKTEKA